MAIKVKSITKGLSTCQHYIVVFERPDGTEHTEIVYGPGQMSDEEENEFLKLWVKYQFKYKADKAKLKNKVIAVHK